MAVLGVIAQPDQPSWPPGTRPDVTVGLSEIMDPTWRGPSDSWAAVCLVTDSVVRLRLILSALAGLPITTKRLELVVSGQPRRGLVHLPTRIGKLFVTEGDIRQFTRPAPHLRVRLAVGAAGRLADLVAATVGRGVSGFGGPTLGLRIGVADSSGEALAWSAGDPNGVVMSTGRPTDTATPWPVDVVLAGAGALAAEVCGSAIDRTSPASRAVATPTGRVEPLVIDVSGRRPSWSRLGEQTRGELERFSARSRCADDLPPVDSDVLSPVGFQVEAAAEDLIVERDGPSRLVLRTASGRSRLAFDGGSGLTEAAVAHARGFRCVIDDPLAHDGPVDHALFLAQAACAAIPVIATDLPDPTRRLLGEELAAGLGEPSVDDLDDQITRETHALRLHRLAFRDHRTRARWGGLARSHGLAVAGVPSTVSVIVATMRPDLLSRVAEQVAGQDWPDVELVLGLHGFSRDDPRVRQVEASFPRPLTVVELPSSMVFGEVLNQLTERASGSLLAKMDDDDWYSRHHLTDLVAALEYSGADTVTAGAEFMYLQALDLTVRRQRRNGHTFTNRVAGAGLLLATSTLRDIGGWRPIHRAIDTALTRSVESAGGLLYRSHGLGLVVMRSAGGHTWDPGLEYFLRGDGDQWPGFVPPPGILGEPPTRVPLPRSYFGSPATRPTVSGHGGLPAPRSFGP